MRLLLPLSLLALLSACSQHPTPSQTIKSEIDPPVDTASVTQVSFDEVQFREDIKTLSSDEFEGRAPTTRGEKLTLDYLTQAFKAIGLTGANKGDYLQAVPMVSYTASEAQEVNLAGLTLKYREDVVLGSRHDNGGVDIKDAPLVFVGYGISAPEYDWNDYQGIDMTGKIAVMLVNDPGFARPDSGLFNGKAMTYYGRWDYKYLEASKQGALGAIIIHDTAPASYPWSVVENSWTGAQQDLVHSKEKQAERVKVEGWITLDAATLLFDRSGISLENLSDRAANSPINLPLKQSADIQFANTAEYANSYNVVATLPGAKATDEHILFTAHWDHIGVDENRTDDKIYNGALDNASGTAGIMAIARQFVHQAKAGNPAKRSLTFIATTGEEQGLLGSRYYAANPIYPIDKSVAVFNLDSTNIYGRTSDYTIVGKGKSELEQYLIEALVPQNRVATSESRPESGGFFRSDHFSFAQKGVPAVFAGGGSQPVDESTRAYKARMKEIMKGCYHSTCDEYRDDWDLSGALEDIAVYYHAADSLANSSDWPGYYQGTEFHSLRAAKSTESEVTAKLED
ncbi:peptidase M28 [Shewanella sediminis HAW-EB3]|uniref:Peptidase M28 n=1 Tax=Shewanella sediminis (strain HAW-EB3) TaxID=425104 RepID=A8FUC7_SHESH|nr:M28 family metallopeptidase [Shewanella sediminis]ABV36450.1 peptidase M28 [Shewanella sediminis HAW-EB3]